MDEWQRLRLERAKEQDLHCVRVEFSDEAALFWIVGLTDQYEVEIDQNADLWPPSCTCEHHAWLPDILCKHILLCLKLMRVEEDLLSDSLWTPEQTEIYDFLVNAPGCVGARTARHDGTNKSTTNFPDSRLYAA